MGRRWSRDRLDGGCNARDKQPHGKLGAIFVGSIGGVTGGVLSYLLGLSFVAGFNVWSLVPAAIGAVVLIVVLRLLSSVRATVTNT